MNSCFVSNAAAIAKRKLEQNPKPDKKHAQANSRKPHGSEQKDTTPTQKPVGRETHYFPHETLCVQKSGVILPCDSVLWNLSLSIANSEQKLVYVYIYIYIYIIYIYSAYIIMEIIVFNFEQT